MYIFKNALRNVVRSKGRNILIGIIVFIISLSLCIGLSIRQAAASARESTLEDLSITAQISVDRSKMMKDSMSSNSGQSSTKPTFDKSSFKGFSDSLSVKQMKKYAKASTVKSFYYTLTSSLDATGKLEPVTTSSDDSSSSSSSSSSSKSSSSSSSSSSTQQNGMQGGMPGGDQGGQGGQQVITKMEKINGNGDFSITGYSSDEAMTDFTSGASSITDGKVFDEGTTKYQCIISEDLAEYNSLEVGDKIKLANPNDDDETYKLTIVGIYKSSESVDQGMGNMFSNSDPSNKIYMSYNALKKIVDKSKDKSDDDAIFSQTSGTYTFASVDDYNTFSKEVYKMGLSDDYTVSSQDLQTYENSLVPLDTLSTIAGYFLIVVLAIGTLILIVLNIFSIRERKYEIGVLTAIGMKKAKVALQFVYEMLIVTLIAVILGGAVGAISSVPVANTMLQTQISAQQQTGTQQNQAFGRDMGGAPDHNNSGNANMGKTQASGNNYISQITASVNVTVLLELLGICVLLALIASAVSVAFILRYNPLRILSNRD